jgi:hypothetical protein
VVEKVNKQQVVVTVVQCRLRHTFSNINIGIRDARPIREEFVLIPEEVAKSIRMSAKVDPRRLLNQPASAESTKDHFFCQDGRGGG